MRDRHLCKAKRTDNGEWVEGNLILSDDAEEGYEAIIIPRVGSNMFTKHKGLKEVTCDLGFERWYKVDKATICRYTGLTDKSGNKIWENDIVKDDRGNIYKAFWQEYYYQFSWMCVKSDLLPIGAKWDLWSLSKNGDLDTIGNIFDNPELLEVAE